VNQNATTWLALGLLLPITFISFWLDQASQPQSKKGRDVLRHDPDYKVENLSSTRMDPEGMPKYMLSATKMIHYPDDGTTHFTQPNFVRYQDQETPLHIQADFGKVSGKNDLIELTGNVIITKEAGNEQSQTVATTEFLQLLPNEDMAKTDKPVTIEDTTRQVTAVGLELDNKTRVLKLLSDVKVTYLNVRH
jgi:lipopolysaccharide export system protein LptC